MVWAGIAVESNRIASKTMGLENPLQWDRAIGNSLHEMTNLHADKPMKAKAWSHRFLHMFYCLGKAGTVMSRNLCKVSGFVRVAEMFRFLGAGRISGFILQRCPQHFPLTCVAMQPEHVNSPQATLS
jgi:hypothetical protein